MLKNAPTYLNGAPPTTARHAGQRVVRAHMLYGHPVDKAMWTPTQPVVPYCVNQRGIPAVKGRGIEVTAEPLRPLLRATDGESELPRARTSSEPSSPCCDLKK